MEATEQITEKPRKPLTEEQLEQKRAALAKGRAILAEERAAEEIEIPNDGAPQVLMDMRHVYINGERFDRTPGRKELRKSFSKDPRGFVKQMMDMEREYASQNKTVEVESGRVDEGVERCIQIAEDLLRRIKMGEKDEREVLEEDSSSG